MGKAGKVVIREIKKKVSLTGEILSLCVVRTSLWKNAVFGLKSQRSWEKVGEDIWAHVLPVWIASKHNMYNLDIAAITPRRYRKVPEHCLSSPDK